MIYIQTPSLNIPALGFGTYKLTGAPCRKAVTDAIGAGYRHIDTARFYDNEHEVGQGIKDAGVERQALFVTTKIWRTELEADAVGWSVEASLREMGLEYIDLLLIHWPNAEVALAQTLEAMVQAVSCGKVRAVGVSNFPVALWEQAREFAPVVCNQVEYHPFLSQEAVCQAARRSGGAVVAYSPLARAAVWGDPVLESIGQAHGKSAGQVALRWLVQQPGVGAVPKATSRQHIEHNFDIFDFELSQQDMDRIKALACGRRLVQPSWAPQWDPQT